MKEKTINGIITTNNDIDRQKLSLKDELKNSIKITVIVFIDLCGSTNLKLKMEDLDWLCLIYRFLDRVQQLATTSGGKIIKRIGDEVMIEFEKTNGSELFIEKTENDIEMKEYDYKMGIDYGNVYYFNFQGTNFDDPYGTTVDRCARLTGLARGSITCVSGQYYKMLDETGKDKYINYGSVPLKGINEKTDIYIRKGKEYNKEYYKELIEKLTDIKEEGYRYVSRKFEEIYFSNPSLGSGKPFLLRFLLNVPKQNKNISELIQIRTNEDEIKKYIGYLFEGLGYMLSFKEVHHSNNSMIMLFLSANKENRSFDYLLFLPINYSEITKNMKLGDKVGFKGVLIDSNMALEFDYVELT